MRTYEVILEVTYQIEADSEEEAVQLARNTANSDVAAQGTNTLSVTEID